MNIFTLIADKIERISIFPRDKRHFIRLNGLLPQEDFTNGIQPSDRTQAHKNNRLKELQEINISVMLIRYINTSFTIIDESTRQTTM